MLCGSPDYLIIQSPPPPSPSPLSLTLLPSPGASHMAASPRKVHTANTNTDETRPPVSLIPRGWRCRASVVL
ncbi:hypothetical protein E2C01_001285 [Portunus trituberculatus]|uniref:Uncharacterized protein n=1 Tax=Portunus trituberculatus TaxID=210409 RepID=A0A5B7CGB5_PORTR|nr:hypothetical protein [Portunus trituberculatus]